MSQELDPELTNRLKAYRIADLSVSEHDALLGRIVAATAFVPRRPASFVPRSWRADVAAMAAAAVLGFYVGNVFSPTTTTASSTQSAVTQQASSVSAGDFDREVFGVQSWKEVSL